MDVPVVIAGALLIVSPLNYRLSVAGVRRRLRERGGDVERFDRHMDRVWIRMIFRIAPVLGVLVVVVGVSDG